MILLPALAGCTLGGNSDHSDTTDLILLHSHFLSAILYIVLTHNCLQIGCMFLKTAHIWSLNFVFPKNNRQTKGKMNKTTSIT